MTTLLPSESTPVPRTGATTPRPISDGTVPAHYARVAPAAQAVTGWASLPPDDGSRYSVRRLTVTWLIAKTPHTQRARTRDMTLFDSWCKAEGLDPLTARPADLTQFRTWYEGGGGGKVPQASTVARALSSISSWYRFLVINRAAEHNPAADVDRPVVDHDASTTAGMTRAEVDALQAAAEAHAEARRRRAESNPTPKYRAEFLAALRDRALFRLLGELGLRINEALARDVANLTHNAGHRTLAFVAKRGKKRERPLNDYVCEALDEYLAARAAMAGVAVRDLDGPLFATTGAGGRVGRLRQPNVFTTMRQLAREAGIASADRLSLHSLRHAFVTDALADGVPLKDVRDAAGHANPRTTMRYDRDGYQLDRDPTLRRRPPRAVSPDATGEAAGRSTPEGS